MIKVTVSIETDEQYTQVTRQGDDMSLLLAQCISRVADTYRSAKLEAIAEAVAKIVRGEPPLYR
jgi:hypothetical protein